MTGSARATCGQRWLLEVRGTVGHSDSELFAPTSVCTNAEFVTMLDSCFQRDRSPDAEKRGPCFFAELVQRLRVPAHRQQQQQQGH